MSSVGALSSNEAITNMSSRAKLALPWLVTASEARGATEMSIAAAAESEAIEMAEIDVRSEKIDVRSETAEIDVRSETADVVVVAAAADSGGTFTAAARPLPLGHSDPSHTASAFPCRQQSTSIGISRDRPAALAHKPLSRDLDIAKDLTGKLLKDRQMSWPQTSPVAPARAATVALVEVAEVASPELNLSAMTANRPREPAPRRPPQQRNRPDDLGWT